MDKRKRRFGDRREGYRVRTLPPMSRLMPFIMKTRSDAQNLLSDSIDMAAAEKYIHEKRREGMDYFGMLHVFIATYIRAVSQRPAINRFISGQKIFSRHDIEVIMTIKKEMTIDAPDTVIKMVFSPDATAKDVFDQLTARIEENRRTGDLDSDFDSAARILNYFPRIVLRGIVGFLKFLDYFGLLPKGLLAVSPFHGSMVLTSLGSLGIPPVYHHLYDFGNAPLFLAYGAKRRVRELDEDGNMIQKKYMDFRITTDERICDGYYFASALRLMHRILEDPWQLDVPPEQVIRDIP